MLGLKFRLCDSVTVDALGYAGSSSYLLVSAFNRQQLRLGEGVYQLLNKMDGQRTLAQICAQFVNAEDLTEQRQHEILSVLTRLQAAGMLASDVPRDVESLVKQQRIERQRKKHSRWMRLLSPKFNLVDPDAFLSRSFPWLAWLFRPLFLFAWVAICLYAGAQALMHWDALTLYGVQRLDDPKQWILLLCVYPLVKALHELGHCYAAKSGGAAVNEMGLTLLVLLPVPYVDASAASRIADKYRRILVGAAGIMVELLLASLALLVWQISDDGLIRDIAFSIMLIGGVSSLLFNGNPLLRFDGYYVLADAIEIPNLSSRAAQFYQYIFRRYLLGVNTEKPPLASRRERRWFIGFGAAAWFYRLLVSVGIAIFLIVTIPVMGLLMASWLLAVQILMPLWRQLHYFFCSPALAGRRLRSGVALVAGVGAIFALLALVSFPSSTVVDGVVLLPDHAVVRAKVDGFLHSQPVADETPVNSGDVLFVLSNAALKADIEVLRNRVVELETRLDLLSYDERLAREIHAERLAEAKEDLEQQQQREAELIVRSPSEGKMQHAFTGNHEGQYVHQGDMLAYISDQSDIVIRVVATQHDAKQILEGSKNIEVRLADRSGLNLTAKLLGEVPLASDQLPSAALGSRTGGNIQVDARDERGLTALERVFAFDVAIPYGNYGRYVGSRAFVRFEHISSALLPRWFDSVQNIIDKKIYPF